MLTITEQARQELHNILTENTDDPAVCLRLSPLGENQLRLTTDTAKPDDEIIELMGESQLLIEKKLADILQQVALDVQVTPEGTKLVLTTA